MKKIQQYLILGMVLSFACALRMEVGAQANTVSGLIDADQNQAAKEERYADAIYSFTIGELSYKITGGGAFSVQSPKSRKPLANVRLDFPEPAYISAIKYVSSGPDLIVVYDVQLLNRPVRVGDKMTNENVLQKRVARYQGKSLKTKWVAITARSDPTGPLIVAAGSMFVSGVGMIGEIDLATGISLWMHENLSERNPGKYVFFTVPRVAGDFVFFQEDPAWLESRNPETIQVRRRTGEIITMSYKPPE
jgi:hypothetical protein